MKCIICNTNEATVRDRENPFSKRLTVCQKCHGERLRGDLRHILELHNKKKKEWENR